MSSATYVEQHNHCPWVMRARVALKIFRALEIKARNRLLHQPPQCKGPARRRCMSLVSRCCIIQDPRFVEWHVAASLKEGGERACCTLFLPHMASLTTTWAVSFNTASTLAHEQDVSLALRAPSGKQHYWGHWGHEKTSAGSRLRLVPDRTRPVVEGAPRTR